MIQIIKEGTKKITDCNICGCKFSYEQIDVSTETNTINGGTNEYIICPQCGEKIYLKMSR